VTRKGKGYAEDLLIEIKIERNFHMDFQLTKEQQDIKKAAREFALGRIHRRDEGIWRNPSESQMI
jgi:hypothetical protein